MSERKNSSNMFRLRTTFLLIDVVRMVEHGTFTIDHSERVADMAVKVAARYGMPKNLLAVIWRAAILHDIGKIGVGNDIIFSANKLSPEAYYIVKQHPVFGSELLRRTGTLKFESEIILQHHEAWDGSGYPNGIRGNDILLGAKIISIVDTYDALVSSRGYKKDWTPQAAYDHIRKNANKKFCEKVFYSFSHVYKNGGFDKIDKRR